MRVFLILALTTTVGIVGCGGNSNTPDGGAQDGGADGSMSVACATAEILCGSVCTNAATDVAHCGGCGNACAPGETCTLGICECPNPKTTCGGGAGCTTDVTFQTDVDNCGACGDQCVGATSCTGGACDCPAGEMLCNTLECANLATSLDHCGACGNNCDPAATCTDTGGGADCLCPDGTIRDGGRCRVVQRDPLHCGAVGNNCNPDEYCVTGSCTCRSGWTRNLADTACLNLQTDPNNCGTEGMNCMGATPACNNGSCAGGCDAALTDCTDSCVDTATNIEHCGGCGNACGENEMCIQGNCQAFDVRALCTTCPCTDCGNNQACCDDPSYGVVCVDGASCP